MMWGDGGGWWVFMWLWMAVFWVAVIVGAIWFMRSSRGRRGIESAHRLLDQRLARGEIQVDEYRRLEQELSEGSESRSRPFTTLPIAVISVLFLLAIPVAVTAAGGWDMWDMRSMHGIGRNTSESALVRGGTTVQVAIQDFAFIPGNLEVPVGATVTWTNRDSATHDATARDGDWRTERLSEGENASLTFSDPGDYDYYCSIHPNMKARLRVTQAL